jgi:glycosyltransferase involved in cell wall biosynthesis
MRILLVSDFFPPDTGGMEAHVELLAKELLRRGHHVAIVTTSENPVGVAGAVVRHASTSLQRVPRAFQSAARAYPPPCRDLELHRSVRRTASWWKPDLIHAHGWCAFSCYWQGSPPLVITLHDHGMRCPKKTLLRENAECVAGRGTCCATCSGGQSLAKRMCLSAALGYAVPALASHTSRLIAVSESVAGRLAELHGPLPPVEVVPNFITVSDKRASSQSDRRVVLFVGPDSTHKGRPVLIDAFRRLKLKGARLHLVGTGERIEGPDITSTGYLTGEELARQFQTSSVVVVPSVWPEPCPTVALEAMAYGKPVIGSRIGGIPDIVEHGRSGLLVRPNDPMELAAALSAVLADDNLRGRLGRGAQKRAELFDASVVVPRLESSYMAALSGAAS